MISAKEARMRAESVLVERNLPVYDEAIKKAANDGKFEITVVGLIDDATREKMEGELGYSIDLNTLDELLTTTIRW